ncbi:hypothetical protein NQ318_023388 [Aromia moschata]|uniref:Uncharacterized protein n=1 Tax=Aromia moschata TaxID=1265417 RepID=A0AAV8YVY8_9CUCU|nr:hypothetical protein NQ318_023388 [Aromia moschata]
MQYIKNKCHKYGIKLYMLAEPNGLILKFHVYEGSLDVYGGSGHTEKRNQVTCFCMCHCGQGHVLFIWIIITIVFS